MVADYRGPGLDRLGGEHVIKHLVVNDYVPYTVLGVTPVTGVKTTVDYTDSGGLNLWFVAKSGDSENRAPIKSIIITGDVVVNVAFLVGPAQPALTQRRLLSKIKIITLT